MTAAEELLKGAIRKVLSDEGAARRLDRVLATVQRGQERIDRARDRVLGRLGVAGRDDWRRLARRLTGTRRRLRELDARLARAERSRESLDPRAVAAAIEEKPAPLSNSGVDR